MGEPEWRLVLAMADSHAGHELGLLSPATKLPKANAWTGEIEYWSPPVGPTQREAWKDYVNGLDSAQALAREHEARIVGLHVGDLHWGTRFNGRIPGTTMTDQRIISLYNLHPLVDIDEVEAVRIYTGTEVHVPESSEALVAAELRRATDKDIKCFHHERLVLQDVDKILDVAHHGPHPGSRDWLRGNTATYYLRDRVYRDHRLGKRAADVYIRGHYHTFVHVTLNNVWQGEYRQHHLVILPALCGMSLHAIKVTQSDPVLTTGMVGFLLSERSVEVVPFVHEQDLRTEEVL